MRFQADGTNPSQVEGAVAAQVAQYFGGLLADASARVQVGRRLDDNPEEPSSNVALGGKDRRLNAVTYDLEYQLFLQVQQGDSARQLANDLENFANQALFSTQLVLQLISAGGVEALVQDTFLLEDLPRPIIELVSLSHISTSTTSSETVSSTSRTTSSNTSSSTTASTTSSSATSSSTSSATVSMTSRTSTSTSTSSTSSSSSTTSTTTLFILELESAEMRRAFTLLILTFNAPAILVNQTSFQKIARCEDIFDANSTSLFGYLPRCTWLADGKILQVALGSEIEGQAMIKLGQQITIPAGVLAPNHFAISLPAAPTPTMNMSVFSKEAPVQPVAVLSALPPISQACGRVSVSAAASQGNAGRRMVYSWGFGSSSNQDLARELRGYVEAANAGNNPGFVISPANFSRAVAVVKNIMGATFYSSPPKVEFAVNATNWFGNTSQATAIVKLEPSDEPVPLVSPTTAATLEVRNSDEVTFGIETRYLDTSKCAASENEADNSTTTSTTTVAQSYEVVITWDHRDSNGVWTPLDATTLVDLARRPTTVRFPGFSFSPNTVHEFRANASYKTSSPSAKKPSYVFKLKVLPRVPPAAELTGPTEAKETCGFALDASGSKDPSIPAEETSDLTYSWSCQAASTAASDCSSLASLETTGTKLEVPGGQLLAGSYVFKVTVGRTSGGATSEASFTVAVSSTAPPPITISVPWPAGGAVSTQVGWKLGPISATVQSSEDCPVPDTYAWQWALAEEDAPGTVAVLLETKLVRNDFSISGNAEVVLSTSDFKGSFMTPGTKYVYALVLAKTQADMDAITASGSQDLSRYASEDGISVVKSRPMLADAPPSTGTVSAYPMFGYAVRTAFSMSTQGWYDEDTSSVTYAFYRFPVPQGITLSEGAGGTLTVNGSFVPPEIDWQNASSPRFWATLGGQSLRSLGSAPTLLDVGLPVGSYMLAVEARDNLGASSGAVLLGPLVEAPKGGLDPAEASNFISATLASNDANDILTAVSAVSSVPLSNTSAAQQAAMTDQALNALEAAVTVVEPSSAGMQKMGAVLSSVLSSNTGSSGDSGTVNAGAADKASGVLEGALAVALTSNGGSGGVDKAAGDALLGSITLIGDTFGAASSQADSAGGGTSGNEASAEAKAAATAAAAARQARLAAMVSTLGDAAMNNIPVGAAQTLTSVDASGKGTRIALKKADLSSAISGSLEAEGGVKIPGSALLARRLATLGGCSTVGLQQTNWLKSNPFSWANATVGLTAVEKDATVKVLEMKKCGSPVVVDLTQSTPVAMSLDLPEEPTSPAPYGFEYEPACLMFDNTSNGWTTEGLTAQLPVAQGIRQLDCLATVAGGSYTAVFLPVPLPSTTTSTSVTTTATRTSTTSTNTEKAAVPDDGPDTGAIVGGVFGSMAFIGAIVTVFLIHRGYIFKKSPRIGPEEDPKKKPADAWREEAPQEPPAQQPELSPTEDPKNVANKADPEQSQKDAHAHFREWARELDQSAGTRENQPPGIPFEFPSQPVAISGLPHRPESAGPSAAAESRVQDTQKYFKDLFSELKNSVKVREPQEGDASGPSQENLPPRPPPKPPPKRENLNIADFKPLPPPPIEDAQMTGAWDEFPEAPPPLPAQLLETAERIEVRVDSRFQGWAKDFGFMEELGELPVLGNAPGSKDPPPPPPPPLPKHRSAATQSTIPTLPRLPFMASSSSSRMELPALPWQGAAAPKTRPLAPPRIPGAADADTHEGPMSTPRLTSSASAEPPGQMPPPRFPGAATPPLETMQQSSPRVSGAATPPLGTREVSPPPRLLDEAAAAAAAAARAEYAGIASLSEMQPKLKAPRITAKALPQAPPILRASDAAMASLSGTAQPPPPPPAVRSRPASALPGQVQPVTTLVPSAKVGAQPPPFPGRTNAEPPPAMPVRQLTDAAAAAAAAAEQPKSGPMRVVAVQRPSNMPMPPQVPRLVPGGGELQQHPPPPPPPLPGRGGAKASGAPTMPTSLPLPPPRLAGRKRAASPGQSSQGPE